MFSILSKNPAAAAAIRSNINFICINPSHHHHLPLSATQTQHHLQFASLPNNPQDESTPKRKTRRRTQKIDDIPSLAEFMHRTKVLKQYRSFVRLASFLDEQNNGGRNECRAALEEVRVAYRLGVKKGTDSLSRSMAYSEVS
jgi:hypothetical protein